MSLINYLKQRGGKLYILFTVFYVFFILLENYFNSNQIHNSFFNDLKGSLVILTIFISIFLLRDLFSSKDFLNFYPKNIIILFSHFLRFYFYIPNWKSKWKIFPIHNF